MQSYLPKRFPLPAAGGCLATSICDLALHNTSTWYLHFPTPASTNEEEEGASCIWPSSRRRRPRPGGRLGCGARCHDVEQGYLLETGWPPLLSPLHKPSIDGQRATRSDEKRPSIDPDGAEPVCKLARSVEPLAREGIFRGKDRRMTKWELASAVKAWFKMRRPTSCIVASDVVGRCPAMSIFKQRQFSMYRVTKEICDQPPRTMV